MSQGLGGGCAVLAGNWERVRLPRPAPSAWGWPWPLRGGTPGVDGARFRPYNGALCVGRRGAGAPSPGAWAHIPLLSSQLARRLGPGGKGWPAGPPGDGG